MSKRSGKKGGRKKGRTAAQKAATARMIAANKRSRRGGSSKSYVARGSVGTPRKKGKVIGHISRKPGQLYYVTANGSVVETACKHGGCRKKKPRSGRVTSRR